MSSPCFLTASSAPCSRCRAFPTLIDSSPSGTGTSPFFPQLLSVRVCYHRRRTATKIYMITTVISHYNLSLSYHHHHHYHCHRCPHCPHHHLLRHHFSEHILKPHSRLTAYSDSCPTNIQLRRKELKPLVYTRVSVTVMQTGCDTSHLRPQRSGSIRGMLRSSLTAHTVFNASLSYIKPCLEDKQTNQKPTPQTNRLGALWVK